MADLMAGQGRFKGWDDQKKHQLLTALLNVLAKVRPMGMSVYSCTVFFHAYETAKAQIPTPRKLEAMCVNHCVGGLQLKAEKLEGEPITLHLFFDRNEPFLNTVNQVWLQQKKRKNGWPHQVRDIQFVDDTCPGIQAADLLAWILNRHRSEAFARGDRQPTESLSFADDLDRQVYLFFHAWMMVDHHMKVYDDASQITERSQPRQSVKDVYRIFWWG